jgi:predicted RNA binding protein YcfA (HicA-like mRNA interferase family)
MRRCPNKDVRSILKRATKLGWEVARITKHIQLIHPLGYRMTLPCTPRNGTSVRKAAIHTLNTFNYEGDAR